MLLGRIELALMEQEVPKVVFHATRRAQVRFDRVEGDGLVVVLPGNGRLLLAKVHHGLGFAYRSQQRPAMARQHFAKALTLYPVESDRGTASLSENDLR